MYSNINLKNMNTPLNFQQMILVLQNYWAQNGCIILQAYDKEMGAGTSHPATFLRSIGPEPWFAAYVQPSRRPKDSRYGNNPNRLQHFYQYQVVLKPSPANIQDLYLSSLTALGINLELHDLRFVEDNWENPTLGAWGLGWEVWLDGMEITQFTYFQQVGGLDCKPVLGEITYGLERLALYLQQIDNVYDLVWTKNLNHQTIYYRDVFHQHEIEQSSYNLEHSNPELLFKLFDSYEQEASRLLDLDLTIPSYEMILAAAHNFNLLDARGLISVTERNIYITKIRNLSRRVAKHYYQSRLKLDFPLLFDK